MVSFIPKNDKPLATVDTIRSMDYSRGYFYGRYLACGYTVGSLVCLPVSVDDTVCHDRVTPYLKGMTQVTSFCGICVDNGALAEHIRNDWGISFSDKTPPILSVGFATVSFEMGLLAGYLSHTKEPLLALLLTNVSKHDSKVIGDVTLGVQSYYLYRYCWNCRKNRFTDKEWEQKTAEELMCFNMWGIPYRLPLYCSSKCSDEHNERLRAHIRIVPHHLIGVIGEC